MDRRSWYMPKDSADALAAALQDLYWSTHRPKHEVLAALIETALAHRDEVQARLSQ
jgi:membrane-bound lytic murein transglycosylase MltF